MINSPLFFIENKTCIVYIKRRIIDNVICADNVEKAINFNAK